MSCTSYLYNPLRNRKATLRAITDAIREDMAAGLEFDAIACRGMSGALVAPAVADELEKPFFVVRKGEKSHSSHSMESCVGECRTYIVIDDIVDTGATYRAIAETVCRYFGVECCCVGMFLYDGDISGIVFPFPVRNLGNRVWDEIGNSRSMEYNQSDFVVSLKL